MVHDVVHVHDVDEVHGRPAGGVGAEGTFDGQRERSASPTMDRLSHLVSASTDRHFGGKSCSLSL